MELNLTDAKKTLLQSINKFNISINPFLTNSKLTKSKIDEFYKNLKELDAQYDILVYNNSISQDERSQIFQELQKCREKFSLLQKQ